MELVYSREKLSFRPGVQAIDRYRTWIAILLYALLLTGFVSASAQGATGNRSSELQHTPKLLHTEYLLDPSNPAVLTAVKLELTPSSAKPFSVYLQFDQQGGAFYPCNLTGEFWFCQLGDHPSIRQIAMIRILVQ